jgi:nitrogen fixation protein
MILNLEKTIISCSKRKIVGHIVLRNGVATNLEKLDRISKLPFPTTKKAFRSFKDGGLLSKVYTHVCNKNTSFNMILA